MTNSSHFHWVFQACNTGQIDCVELSVIGHLREDLARAAVEELVVRDVYRLLRVYQCNTCAFQAASVEFFKKALE